MGEIIDKIECELLQKRINDAIVIDCKDCPACDMCRSVESTFSMLKGGYDLTEGDVREINKELKEIFE